MKRSAILLLLLVLAFDANAQGKPDVRILPIHSASLEGNAFGDPADQQLAVYLPPGYEASGRRYPVVYLLHGIGDSFEVWTKAWKLPEMLDRLIASKRIAPIIVSMPNGRNRFLGSYYVNSPVSGRWEDYIANDIVGLVDKTFRTIAKPGGRGVAGHSMGGYGAISLGMHRADVFGAVYAISPCCLDFVEDVGYGNTDAYRRFLKFTSYDDADKALQEGHFYPVALLALLSATAPNPAAPLRVDVPVKEARGELVPVSPAYERFRDTFPVRTAPRYAANLRKLRALHMDYGYDDQFAHIPVATATFSRVLTELRIPHVLDAYDGDHREHVVKRLETIIFPMMAATLDAQ